MGLIGPAESIFLEYAMREVSASLKMRDADSKTPALAGPLGAPEALERRAYSCELRAADGPAGLSGRREWFED